MKQKKTIRSKTTKQNTRSLPKSLTSRQVFNPCPQNQFDFRTTKQVDSTNEIISQKRAVRAINMGLGIRKPGYNIYVAGYQGTGKTSVIRSFLEKWSKDAPPPNDWIYVFDFKKQDTPKAIQLPTGRGRELAKYMDEAIKRLKEEIPAALQSEEYENTVNARLSKNNDKQARKFSDLEKIAKNMNFQIKSTRMGIETIPVVDGRPLTEKEYNKLSDKNRTAIEKTRSKLEPQVLEFARIVRSLETDAKDFVIKLQKEFGQKVLDDTLGPIEAKFSEFSEVAQHLSKIREHILENLLNFVEDEAAEDDYNFNHPPHNETKDRFRKYRINVFVDNHDQKGAPVVIESNPSYYNLFGKVEKNVEHGMFLTDFTMITAGVLHKASGGYLVLEAADVFKMPSVWDTLKRVLRNRKGFIEDMGEQYSMFPTSGIRPEPIPLDVKVILIGTDDIYHMLHDLDDEFSKIFKIKADFDYKMPRTAENIDSYVSFIATRSHKEDLLHFDKSGVAAIVEYGSRLVEDQQQLTTQFGELKDLTIETDFIAREQNSKVIKRIHVEEALRQKYYRVNLMENHLIEAIGDDDIMISVQGELIGQINGLAVYDLGDYSFGKPGRITCTVSANDDGIFNIDRASKLSGNIHDKGMYILTSFINTLLARDFALNLSASVCFEQSYGTVDGDSATIAKLVCIISAMAKIPIKQNLAITGSLNQLGEAQPVGGINEKIEGFIKTCLLLGGSKSYKIIIPHQNVSSLMLNHDTRQAISDGILEIYPVKYFWQAFKIATDCDFGATSIYDESFAKGSALDIIKTRSKKIHDEETKDHSDNAQ